MNPSRVVALLLVAAVAAGAPGCWEHTSPLVVQPGPQTPAERNFQALWLAAQEVLREYRFTVDRLDRRAGLITTEPLTGQQFFEPWRKDAVNRSALADGSLKTLYRTVVVRIQPTGPGADQYELFVEVSVAKPGSAPMEIHSTGAAYGMFILPEAEEDEEAQASILDYTFQRPGEEQEPNAAAQPTYQDAELAKQLADDILAAAARHRAMGG